MQPSWATYGEHDFVRRLRVAVSGWYRRVAAQIHTHTVHLHVYTTNRELVWSLFVPRSSRVRYISLPYVHIGAHTRKNIYRYTRVHTRTYIKPSTPSRVSYLFLCFAISPSNVSFRVPFPRLAFMAGIHGSGEIRVPSSPKLVIET